MLVPAIVPLLWPLTDSLSTVWKPLLIVTVALARLPALSGTVSTTVLSSVTGLPPPVKVGVPSATMAGAVCTAVSVLVSAAEFDVPSFTVQVMVRVVSPPPPVGSPPDVKL